MIEIVLALLLSKPVTVTWTVVQVQYTSCGGPSADLSKYGVESGLSQSYAALCTTRSTKPMKAEMESLVEAAKFIRDAPFCYSFYGFEGTDCVKDFEVKAKP